MDAGGGGELLTGGSDAGVEALVLEVGFVERVCRSEFGDDELLLILNPRLVMVFIDSRVAWELVKLALELAFCCLLLGGAADIDGRLGVEVVVVGGGKNMGEVVVAFLGPIFIWMVVALGAADAGSEELLGDFFSSVSGGVWSLSKVSSGDGFGFISEVISCEELCDA